MDPYLIENIVCPQCQAMLDVSATACPQCGAATTTPMRTVNRDPPEKQRLLDKPWLIVILVLHLGFLGIPLYWKTSYSLGVRIWMVVASIVYTVVAVVAIVSMLWKIARDLGLIA